MSTSTRDATLPTGTEPAPDAGVAVRPGSTTAASRNGDGPSGNGTGASRNGHRAGPPPPRTVAPGAPTEAEEEFAAGLLSYRDVVLREMRRIIAGKRFRRPLSGRLAEYPLREGKGLRPALCLATCQAYGGALSDALPSAAALELFHNAFLVHDDVEDESVHRRGDPTLHQRYGVAIAVNVGDALNVLTMTPLLQNLEVIGLEKTLRVFREIERMGRESVEGQAMELEWARSRSWGLTERDYRLMTLKKTSWYTCITPCRIGALIGGGAGVDLGVFTRFGRDLGIAFQVQDDLLNLVGDEARYGKETAGDIREGKRTLMLIALLDRCTDAERERVVATLSKARDAKTDAEVEDVLALMHRHGCIDHGRRVARAHAERARGVFRRGLKGLPDTPHKRFLEQTVEYVVHRDL